MNFFLKYRTQIIILVIVLVIILTIYFLGKHAGKKYVPKEVPLPADTQPGEMKNFNPGTYTDAVKDELYGFGFRSAGPYNELLTLSNSQFVAVYNDWNKRYFEKHNETLPGAIKAEMGTVWNYSWVTAVGAVLERCSKLGLQ